MRGAPGRTATIYTDTAGAVLADILTYDGTATPGAAIAGSTVTIDAYSQMPRFWFPDDVDTVYARANGGPPWPVNADYDYRLDAAGLSPNDTVVVTLPNTGQPTLTSKVTGDTQNRLSIDANGKHTWGSGAAVGDTNLYRYAADVLATDDRFFIQRSAANQSLEINNPNAGGDGIAITLNGATRYLFLAGTSADADWRVKVSVSGKLEWGNGTLAVDTNLYRSAADILATDDDLAIVTAGKGLRVKEGSNAKAGVATLVAGTVTVATTAVTATSRIQLTGNSDGGTPGWLRVSTRTASTSFVITSSSGTDTSTVAWFIVDPA